MKKSVKKLLSLMLCCIMVLGLFPTAAFATTDYGYLDMPAIEKIVETDGDVDPGTQTFTFELVGEGGDPINAYGITVTDNTVTTDGAGTYYVYIKLRVDSDVVDGLIADSNNNLWVPCTAEDFEDFYSCNLVLKERNDNDKVSGWTYSDELYYVEIRYYHFSDNDGSTISLASFMKYKDGKYLGEDEKVSFTNTYSATSAPESTPIRDTVTIEIGNNEKPEEANPNTGAPVMFVPVMAAALAGAVIVRRKK